MYSLNISWVPTLYKQIRGNMEILPPRIKVFYYSITRKGEQRMEGTVGAHRKKEKLCWEEIRKYARVVRNAFGRWGESGLTILYRAVWVSRWAEAQGTHGTWGTEGNLRSMLESSRGKARKALLVNDNKNGLSHLSYTTGSWELQRGRFWYRPNVSY